MRVLRSGSGGCASGRQDIRPYSWLGESLSQDACCGGATRMRRIAARGQ
ncbi:unnamed protein product [Burkholderia pseudomallei]|nr:hypothetical protein BURPSS13_Q0080 [Burkholderia pseudomallei S13]VUD51770.1 unnamed protein product [Burkholderia pseudomallei]VUD52278.1 unnamed protein product [Burkholderia pseudomallei]